MTKRFESARRWLARSALCLAAAGAAPGALAGQERADTLDVLRRSVERAARPETELVEADVDRLEMHLSDAERAVAADGARERELLVLELDLATLPDLDLRREELARLGRRALQARVAATSPSNGPSAAEAWLAHEVIPSSAGYTPRQRELAIELVRGRPGGDVARALLVAAAAGDADVRARALAALAPRSEPEVRRYFLRALESAGANADADLRTQALQHLRATRPVTEPDVAERLYRMAQVEIGAESWRRASLGVQLASALELARAGPLLIESLALWQRRAEAGKGGLRIQSEIARELERYSGKQYGVRLPSWRAWWRALAADAAAGVSPAVVEGPRHHTEAAFFGIRVQSDRVVFVIDQSGSMADPMTYDGRSRFEEAARQLEAYLISAPKNLMFAVVLFNDRTRAWRRELAPATPESIGSAVQFVRYQRADRGTWLEGGLLEALAFAPDESEASEATAADTVVVLCDGETGDASWVDRWLRDHNAVARLVFHCVQIGGSSTGALEALARATGGDFARVETP